MFRYFGSSRLADKLPYSSPTLFQPLLNCMLLERHVTSLNPNALRPPTMTEQRDCKADCFTRQSVRHEEARGEDGGGNSCDVYNARSVSEHIHQSSCFSVTNVQFGCLEI